MAYLSGSIHVIPVGAQQVEGRKVINVALHRQAMLPDESLVLEVFRVVPVNPEPTVDDAERTDEARMSERTGKVAVCEFHVRVLPLCVWGASKRSGLHGLPVNHRDTFADTGVDPESPETGYGGAGGPACEGVEVCIRF